MSVFGSAKSTWKLRPTPKAYSNGLANRYSMIGWILIIATVVGLLYALRRGVSVWIIALAPAMVTFVIYCFVRFNPRLLHGGSGTWSWWSERPAGEVSCADHTFLRLP